MCGLGPGDLGTTLVHFAIVFGNQKPVSGKRVAEICMWLSRLVTMVQEAMGS